MIASKTTAPYMNLFITVASDLASGLRLLGQEAARTTAGGEIRPRPGEGSPHTACVDDFLSFMLGFRQGLNPEQRQRTEFSAQGRFGREAQPVLQDRHVDAPEVKTRLQIAVL